MSSQARAFVETADYADDTDETDKVLAAKATLKAAADKAPPHL